MLLNESNPSGGPVQVKWGSDTRAKNNLLQTENGCNEEHVTHVCHQIHCIVPVHVLCMNMHMD